MSRYEELYKHAQVAFEEEGSRFARLEDKAARFITIISSLLAVYALAGRQVFASMFPINGTLGVIQVTLSGLVLMSLVVSWGFAFRALQLQGTRKHPLSDEVLEFFHKHNLPTIHWAMAKRYCEARDYNKRINDRKADNLKRCFKSTIFIVILFVSFIIAAAFDANGSNKNMGGMQSVSTSTQPRSERKEITMSENNDNSQPENVSPGEQSQAGSDDLPDFDVIAPEFEISTESFDPTIVHGSDSKEEK